MLENITNDDLMTLVSECNSWDGSFEHLEKYDTEYDLDMFAEGNDALWLAQRIYHGNFNPYHEYFNFNEYGNLVSFSDDDYDEMINDERDDIIERALELHEAGDIDISEVLNEYQ